MISNYEKIIIDELHPLKLFNIVSERTRIDFLKSTYFEFLDSGFDENVLYYALNNYELESYRSQASKKISSIALIAFDFDELTVLEINKNYEFIEDILLNAELFFKANYLTEKNKFKLLNYLLNNFSIVNIFDNYIENLILNLIEQKQPVHKNILFNLLRKLVEKLSKEDIEWSLKKLLAKNKIHQLVTGYSLLNKNLEIAEKTESNFSKILYAIGNYFIDLENLINYLINSDLNLPKNPNYLKRLIESGGFNVDDGFVISPQQQDLETAIDNWLQNFPGIIDKSNTDKAFSKNKRFKSIIKDKLLLPYNVDKYLNVKKFIDPLNLNILWEKIYKILPDNRIWTLEEFSDLVKYKEVFEGKNALTENIFSELFLGSLISSDNRIYKINRYNHIFHKSRRISKLDLIYEIVINNDRISIQMLRHRLEKDYGVNSFSYDLITKSIVRFGFYKDSQHYIYSSHEKYINFMRRGQ